MYDNYSRPAHEKYLVSLYGARVKYIPDIVEAMSSWEHTQYVLGNYEKEVSCLLKPELELDTPLSATIRVQLESR